MKAFRVLPAGCPACGSRSMRYDWTRRSNVWRVPVTIAFALVPLPISNLRLLCESCGHQFKSREDGEWSNCLSRPPKTSNRAKR